MLRFEKNNSGSIGIKLRDKKCVWTIDLLLALSAALFLHLLAPFIFSIKSISPEKNISPPSILVLTDSFSLPLQLDMQETDNNILPPPIRPLLSLSHTVASRRENLMQFGFIPKKRERIKAFLRGSAAKLLNINDLLPPNDLKEESGVTLSIRSDDKGELFWYDWIQKPTNFQLQKEIERWIKLQNFSKDQAFYPQLIELHFFND